MNEKTKQYQQHEQIIAKCWADEAFKRRFMADPVAVLKAEGIAVPEGVRVHVVENTDQDYTFVIPKRSAEASDEVVKSAVSSTIAHTEDLLRHRLWHGW